MNTQLTWNDVFQMVSGVDHNTAIYDIGKTGYDLLHDNNVIYIYDPHFPLMLGSHPYLKPDPTTGKCDDTCFGQYFFGKVKETCQSNYAECVMGFSFLGVESNSGSVSGCAAPDAAQMFDKKQGHVISGVNEFALLVDKVLAANFPGVTTTLAAVQAEYSKKYLKPGVDDVKRVVFTNDENAYVSWYSTVFYATYMMTNQDEMFLPLKKLVSMSRRKFLPAGNWKAGLDDTIPKQLDLPFKPFPCALGFLVYHVTHALGINFERDDKRKTDWSNGRAWAAGYFYQQQLLVKGATITGTASAGGSGKKTVKFPKCEIPGDKATWVEAFDKDTSLLEEELNSI